MIHFIPSEKKVPEVHQILLGGVAPRPIALVSTVDADGRNNLSPFSFFNVFGVNPPVLAFSPSRRGRDASLKDTYNNLMQTGECVVQSVTYAMVEQISLASTEYPPDVDEFIKSGLTPLDSDLVKPKRVKESPFQMECRLLEMKSYGSGGASANIAICEVLKFHVAEDIFRDGIIQPDLIDLAARMSGDYYCRASGSAVFKVEKPILKKGVGYDSIPEFMRESDVYTASNLGKFGNIESVPGSDEVDEFLKEVDGRTIDRFEPGIEAFRRYQRQNDYLRMLKAVMHEKDISQARKKLLLELTAKCALENNDTLFAWKTALFAGRIK